MWRRSRLINMLIEKEESDRKLWAWAMENQRQNGWYAVRLDALEPAMADTFHQAQYDQESEQFLSQSLSISNNICLQLYYSLMATVLSVALTKTSINGLLGRGSMFIFSRAHLRAFLSIPDDWSPIDKRLLDIGAGDGAVTVVLKHFFGQISAVEASKVMEWRLAQRGFKLLPVDKWAQSGSYDLICALNLLDRHHDPMQLLSDIHRLALESGGGSLVLLSLVLPVKQFVEFAPSNGSVGTTASQRNLLAPNCCEGYGHNLFEAQASALVRDVFEPTGFQLLRWTKLPYLCEGDLARAFYKLDDAVFLLRALPRMPTKFEPSEKTTNGPVETTTTTYVQIHDEI